MTRWQHAHIPLKGATGKSLQALFVESLGKPVQVGELLVKQPETIPITEGSVRIRFVKGYEKDCGIRLKAKGGWISLSDGSRSKVVDTWRSPDLPDEITYMVSRPTGSLRFWNIYRTFHPGGAVTEDAWTGNAGMVVLSEQSENKLVGCSSGSGGFDPSGLVVEIEWFDQN